MKSLSSKVSGFTLVENMASMLVISVGLLGTLGLFINGIKNTDSAYLRSQAVVLAYDIADRMRANPSELSNYNLPANTTLTAPGNSCDTDACSASQIAAANLYEWQTRVLVTLPEGDAVVAAGVPTTTITLSWDHLGESRSYSVDVNL